MRDHRTGGAHAGAAGPAGRWVLDPAFDFLNHGSFGACPKAVLAAQSELRARMERQPMRFMLRELEGMIDAAREALARFVGADAEGIAFVPNATTAVSAVLRSLEGVRFGPGDELLTTDHAYGACKNALDFSAERSGARVRVARVPFPLRGPDEIVGPILEAVTERTRLVLLDHVTSQTALVFPVERLVREIEARGAWVLVDGAHAPGTVPLDIGAVGAHFYAANLHKWVCAPKGAAFLHVREDVRNLVRPTVISHGATRRREGRSRYRMEFDWTGTADPTPFLCVPAAIEEVGGMLPGGWPEVMRANHEKAVFGRRVLAAALGAPEPCPPSMLGSMATLPLPPLPAGEAPPDPLSPFDPLQNALYEAHRIEVPVFPWPAPPARCLRISAQLYVDPAAYRRLADATLAFSRRA